MFSLMANFDLMLQSLPIPQSSAAATGKRPKFKIQKPGSGEVDLMLVNCKTDQPETAAFDALKRPGFNSELEDAPAFFQLDADQRQKPAFNASAD